MNAYEKQTPSESSIVFTNAIVKYGDYIILSSQLDQLEEEEEDHTRSWIYDDSIKSWTYGDHPFTTTAIALFTFQSIPCERSRVVFLSDEGQLLLMGLKDVLPSE